MPSTSAAMELKVLINILTQGQALPTLLNQTKQLSQALSDLQTKANAAGGANIGAGATAVAKDIAAASSEAAKGLSGMEAAGLSAAKGIGAIEGAANSAVKAVKFLTGGFLAFEGVRFLKNLADEAARVEVLGTVLHVVALNSGYTSEQIDKIDKKIQSLGITADASRQSLTQFLQANLDVKFAPQLARAAQDLAVISGRNSSEAFQLLVTHIQQLSTVGLRWMGVVVDLQAAETRYRDLHKEITGALTKRQEQEALLLEVLEKGKQLQGTYTNAMGDVGKQLTSLDRYTQTYMQTLGAALLPAYSAIVSEVTLLFEKLTLLGEEFSANSQRSQEWANTARELSRTLSNLIVFVAEHLDQIVQLVKWYAEFRIALLAWNVLSGIATRLATFIELIRTVQLVTVAWRAGTISLALAIEALGTSSVAAATKVMAVAAAEEAAGTAAVAATAGVSSLTLAWPLLIAALAVSAIGYIIIKERRERAEDEALPLEERAARAKKNMEEGKKDIADEAGPTIGVDSGFSLRRLFGGSDEPVGTAYLKFFEDWKKIHPELIAGLKTEQEQLKAYNAWIDSSGSKLKEYVDKIAAADTKVKAAVAKQLDIKPGSPPAERLLADKDVKDASEAAAKLRTDLEKTVEASASAPTQTIFKQMERVKSLTDDVAKMNADRKKYSEGELTTKRTQLEVEKKLLDTQMEGHAKALEAAGIDPSRAKDEEYLAKLGKSYSDLGPQQEAFAKGTQELFGGATFDEKGMTSGGFVKAFSGYEAVLEAAKIAKDKYGTVPVDIAKELTEGMAVLGKAAKTEVDFNKIKKALTEGKDLGVSGLAGAGQSALGVARLGVDKEALAADAPNVAERIRLSKIESDAKIAAASRYFETVKYNSSFLNEQLEEDNRQNLVSLKDYYDQRIARTEVESQAELNVIGEKIAQQQELQNLTQDSDAKKAFDPKIRELRDQEQVVYRKNELTKKQLQDQEADRVRTLTKELQTAVLAQEAGAGGQEAAIKQLNFQLDEEEKKYAALGDPMAHQLVIMERITKEYEIQKNFRDQAYKAEDDVLKAKQDQLSLAKDELDLAAARDKTAVSKGVITQSQADRRNNVRIQQEEQINRAEYAVKEQELQNTINRGLTEEIALRERLKQQRIAEIGATGTSTITNDEIERRVTAQKAAVQEQATQVKASMVGLDKAYEDMAASMTSTSQQLAKSIADSISKSIADAIVNFRSAKDIFKSLAESIANDMVTALTKPFLQALTGKIAGFLTKLLSGGGGGMTSGIFAEGGVVSGPGTGTSDSVPALLSTGEHVMPAAKAAQWMPLLEGIRLGKVMPAYALGGVVDLQSIAIPSLIPRRYANGGVVVSDGGASAVTPGAAGPGNMIVSLHPDAMQMTMREWLENEVVRQQGRR